MSLEAMKPVWRIYPTLHVKLHFKVISTAVVLAVGFGFFRPPHPSNMFWRRIAAVGCVYLHRVMGWLTKRVL